MTGLPGRLLLLAIGACSALVVFSLLALIIRSGRNPSTAAEVDQSRHQNYLRDWTELGPIDAALPHRELSDIDLLRFLTKPIDLEAINVEYHDLVLGKYRGALVKITFCVGDWCSSKGARFIYLDVVDSVCPSYGGVAGIWKPYDELRTGGAIIDYGTHCTPASIVEAQPLFHVSAYQPLSHLRHSSHGEQTVRPKRSSSL